jgi:energy-converting hydrogenase Eha subunit C
MERHLSEGMATKTLLEITTWKNVFFTSSVGIVLKINPLNKTIQLQDEFESIINSKNILLILLSFRTHSLSFCNALFI